MCHPEGRRYIKLTKPGCRELKGTLAGSAEALNPSDFAVVANMVEMRNERRFIEVAF
jgi:hypothetical protein